MISNKREAAASEQAPVPQRRCVASREPLKGDREIAVLHAGQEYRLQGTKNGRPILTN